MREVYKIFAPERGSALVEAAVVFPVLVFLFVAVAQLGMFVNARLIVSEATREAAREYVLFEDDEGIERASSRAAAIIASLPYGGSFDLEDTDYFNLIINAEDVTVTINYGCPVIVPGLGSLLAPDSASLGNELMVTGKATFRREVTADD